MSGKDSIEDVKFPDINDTKKRSNEKTMQNSRSDPLLRAPKN